MNLRPNGIWQSDFTLSNGERIRKSLGTKNKSEARIKEVQIQADMEKALKEGVSTAPQRSPNEAPSNLCGISLKEAFKRAKGEHDKWRDSTSPKTIEGNYNFVAEHLGATRDIATITKLDMIAYSNEMQAAGKSKSTINQRLSIVSVILKYAEEWTEGKVGTFKMPRRGIRNGRIRTLSYEEEDKVVKWFASPERKRRDTWVDMAALTTFLVDTGFRLTEAITLQSREIDWELGMVPAWETKADHPRLVPMTQKVAKILEDRKHLDRPFGMFSKDSADDHWEAMRKGLSIDTKKDPEFVIHALRHTCCSRLVASGMDAFRVQKWMGHKSIMTTKRYVNLYAPDLRQLAAALDDRRGTNNAKVSVSKNVSKGALEEVK